MRASYLTSFVSVLSVAAVLSPVCVEAQQGAPLNINPYPNKVEMAAELPTLDKPVLNNPVVDDKESEPVAAVLYDLKNSSQKAVSSPTGLYINNDTGVDLSKIQGRAKVVQAKPVEAFVAPHTDSIVKKESPVVSEVAVQVDEKPKGTPLERVLKQTEDDVVSEKEEVLAPVLKAESDLKDMPKPAVAADPIVVAAPVPSASAAVADKPRVFSNAEELGVMMGVQKEDVVPLQTNVVVKEVVEPASDVVEVSTKTVRFEDRPVDVMLERGEPVRASHILKQRYSSSKVGVVPVQERNVPAMPKGADIEFEPKAVAKAVSSEVVQPIRSKPAVQDVVDVAKIVEPRVVAPEALGEKFVQNSIYKADLDRQFIKTGEWKSLAGYDLKEVLYHWSQRAGVALVWDSPQPFTTVDPLRYNGSYADAVAILLDQYGDSVHRPVAKIYEDGQTGQRYLVIQNAS